MKLLSIIKKIFHKLFSFDNIPRHQHLKIKYEFLFKSLEQTSQEIPDFKYEEWKEKYGDDMFYFLFEQQFRGSSKVIKERQKIYI
ncbi:MAG: hypothetical protein RMJ67_02815, partial [Elusimicrobiota bacterium]|nr:hypothetical protein [Endomicrobiia bacterium]MDW8165429.1 hypothetical protein [Elusimicrobiota bacterium]